MVLSHLAIGVIELDAVMHDLMDGDQRACAIRALTAVDEHRLVSGVGDNCQYLLYLALCWRDETERDVKVLKAKRPGPPRFTVRLEGVEPEVDDGLDAFAGKLFEVVLRWCSTAVENH